MRLKRLVFAATAGIAALAPLPALASARLDRGAGARAGGQCRVHVEVPRTITAGESATLFGTLSCPKGELPGGKQLTVYKQSEGAPGSSVIVGTVSTEASGAFQFTPPIFTTNSVFSVIAAGAKGARGTKGARGVVKVAPQITATTPTPPEGAQLYAGGGLGSRAANQVTFAGTVSPVQVGELVTLQREASSADEEWRRIGVGSVGANGQYSLTHHFAVPGDVNLRIVVHPHNGNVASATTPVSYEISPAQNPRLTIATSSDPLSYAQSAAISGVLAGGASGTPVTLLARSRGGSFTPVASAQTSEGGKYQFTQTPLENTSYRVVAGSINSSVLFEGVKYAITVAQPASSVPEGQALTFSGGVLPGLAGHVVYLERQGASKLNWHVIDVGTAGTPAAPGQPAPFSIAHAFYSLGSQRLRLKVPGDPGNQGVASAPFELTVTPVAASLLAPPEPGNSKLPVEGQL
jgi:hypothetical protein